MPGFLDRFKRLRQREASSTDIRSEIEWIDTARPGLAEKITDLAGKRREALLEDDISALTSIGRDLERSEIEQEQLIVAREALCAKLAEAEAREALAAKAARVAAGEAAQAEAIQIGVVMAKQIAALAENVNRLWQLNEVVSDANQVIADVRGEGVKALMPASLMARPGYEGRPLGHIDPVVQIELPDLSTPNGRMEYPASPGYRQRKAQGLVR